MTTRNWNMHKSHMQSYKYCQRYFYNYTIKGIPVPKSPYRAQLGTNFHAYSAEFYDIVDVRKEPTVLYYRSLLPVTGGECDPWYDKFAEFEARRMLHILNEGLSPWKYFLPIAKELTIELDDHMMGGTIDRIWLHEDGYPFIQDVKPRLPTARTNLRRELAFYTYLCNHYEPLADEWGPFEYVSGYGYREGEVWIEKLKSRTVKAMFVLLDLIDYDISYKVFKEEWPRNMYGFCHDCAYSYDCWVAEGENIPMPDLMRGRKEKKSEGTWKSHDAGGDV